MPSPLPALPKDIPWKRFWCPLGRPIDCGPDAKGFLSDPDSEFGKYQNPHTKPLLEFVPETGPLVLCGEPGMGKTTELERLLRQLRSESDGAIERVIYLFSRDISDASDFRRRTVDSEKWKQWGADASTMTLIVDGIDEGLIRVPNLINNLTGILRDASVERVRLILACRTAEWPPAQGADLLWLWNIDGRNPIIELCPLRDIDAQVAAKASSCDPAAFLKAIWEKQVVGLAARPITLSFLLKEFGTTQALPATHRELYELGIRNLAAEIDDARMELLKKVPGRPPVASVDDRLLASQHIATILLCSGKSAVQRIEEHGSPGSDLLMSDCLGAVERDASLPSHAFDQAVESGLFTAFGIGRFGFAHQTFAECLAAQRLGRLGLRQLRSLLCQQDDQEEHVVPQLAELAAWVAGCQADFCNHLLAIDPMVLLRSDVAKLAAKLKEQLVSVLLTRAMNGITFGGAASKRFLSGLTHPGLADQLRPIILDTALEYNMRDLAMDIAHSCRLDALTDDLLLVVANAGEEQRVRDDAARALSAGIHDDVIQLLEPLAKGEVGDDPRDTIRDWALQRLLLSHWKLRDALPCFTSHGFSSFMGSYFGALLERNPGFVEKEDIVPALKWITSSRGWWNSTNPEHELAVRSIALAIGHISDPGICEALANAWLATSEFHAVEVLAEQKEVADAFKRWPSARSRLTTSLLNHPNYSDNKFYEVFYQGPLLNCSNDLHWLIDQLTDVSTVKRASWVGAVGSMVIRQEWLTPCWDKFLYALDQIPELRTKFEWVRAWALDEPLAIDSKAHWLKDQDMWSRHRQRRQRAKPDVDAIIESTLLRADLDDPDCWYTFWKWLSTDDDGHIRNSSNPVIQERPRWATLSECKVSQATKAARSFLLHYSTKASGWHPSDKPALAAKSAVWLLKDTWQGDTQLNDAMIKSWASLCSHCSLSDQLGYQKLFAALYKFAPTQAITSLIEEAEEDASRPGGFILAFNDAKLCWDSELSHAARSFLKRQVSPRIVGDGIEAWASLDKGEAKRFAIEWFQASLPREGFCPVSLVQASASLLQVASGEGFDLADKVLREDDHLASAVWRRVLAARTGSGNWGESFSESQLVQLYRHLKRLSQQADLAAPMQEDGQRPSSGMGIWTSIPEMLAAMGTKAACQELMVLASEVAGDERISILWSHSRAQHNFRRNAWVPPQPKEVGELLRRAGTRLVQSGEDLLELVIESLGRYQDQLTGSALPAVEGLWNETSPKDEEALSDDVARWLTNDLGPSAGIVANREVQPRRRSKTDIFVQAVPKTNSGEFEPVSVTIEVKGCWHREVKSAMHSQLVEGYLRDNGERMGLYVVGWFVCDRWKSAKNKTGCDTLEESQKYFANEVCKYNGKTTAETVKAIVLDCTVSSVSPSQRGKRVPNVGR